MRTSVSHTSSSTRKRRRGGTHYSVTSSNTISSPHLINSPFSRGVGDETGLTDVVVEPSERTSELSLLTHDDPDLGSNGLVNQFQAVQGLAGMDGG